MTADLEERIRRLTLDLRHLQTALTQINATVTACNRQLEALEAWRLHHESETRQRHEDFDH